MSPNFNIKFITIKECFNLFFDDLYLKLVDKEEFPLYRFY